MRLLFAILAAAFGAQHVSRREMGAGIKPTGKGGMACDGGGFASEIGKDRLSDVLCPMRVSAYLAQRGRINEVEVSIDQLTKGIFGAISNILREEGGVIHGGHSSL